ncbi:RrF2 family transcriptional regulator [Vannielia litorea]|uniref:RrF2 family transcriptional regulator n=1 Tax=Vannielia litorea TaxID=1217970 RepID=UPI001BCC5690|nr:Rrf2 family transcriptional regulator [Vannielia litorea]MBS8229047.1 Rrf2 family transcriptional regulator [Vannielia litorea]
MQLRNQVEWALHCCSILAGLPPGQRLSTKALAEFHGVPKPYLSKALQSLAQAGLIEGTLGPSGGYRLARPAAEISFLEITEAIEGRARSFACTEIRRNAPCLRADEQISGPCQVARVMWQADEAWRAVLRSQSLADLSATLEAELPERLLADAEAWVGARSAGG